MAFNPQLTGMLGVYYTAARLTEHGFIVSPTSRSAIGADLLVTDLLCQKAWSVQVKTDRTAGNFWLLNRHAARMISPSHVYVFVKLRGEALPVYYVVPSEHVGAHVDEYEAKKTQSRWYTIKTAVIESFREGWQIFGDPVPDK